MLNTKLLDIICSKPLAEKNKQKMYRGGLQGYLELNEFLFHKRVTGGKLRIFLQA